MLILFHWLVATGSSQPQPIHLVLFLVGVGLIVLWDAVKRRKASPSRNQAGGRDGGERTLEQIGAELRARAARSDADLEARFNRVEERLHRRARRPGRAARRSRRAMTQAEAFRRGRPITEAPEEVFL